MIRDLRLSLARALGDNVIQIMPSARRDWAIGMRAELEAIDDPGAALTFAVGCVAVGYGRRLRTTAGALAVVRYGVATGAVLLSGVALSTAWRAILHDTAHALPIVLASIGLAFLAAGVMLAWRGARPVLVLAAIMLALNTGAAGLLQVADLPHEAFYSALSLEAYGLWGALLLISVGLWKAPGSPRLAAAARALGWDE